MWITVLAGCTFIYGMCAGYMNEGMTPRLGEGITGLIWLGLAVITFLFTQSEVLMFYRGMAYFVAVPFMSLCLYTGRSFFGRFIISVKMFLIFAAFDAILFGAFWLTGWEAPAGTSTNIRYYFYSMAIVLLVICTYHPLKSFVLGRNSEKGGGHFFDYILLAAFAIEVMPIAWMDDYVYHVNPYGEGYIVIFFLLILILDCALIYVLHSTRRQFQQEREAKLLEQHRDYQKKYYETVDTQYQRSREFVHDMQNHVMILSRLYAQDEVERAQRYAESVLLEMPTALNESD